MHRQPLCSKEYLRTLETLQRYWSHDFLLSEAFITAVFVSETQEWSLLVRQSPSLQARSYKLTVRGSSTAFMKLSVDATNVLYLPTTRSR